MKQSTIETLDAIVSTEDRTDQWDMMPMLSIIYDAGDGRSVLAMVVLTGDTLPNMLWGLKHKIVQTGNGDSLSAMGIPTGMVLRWEAWGVKSVTRSENDQLLEWAAENSLEQHPNRVEVKGLMAIDDGGMEYRLFERGATEWEVLPASTVEGRVPEALQFAFNEIKALAR